MKNLENELKTEKIKPQRCEYYYASREQRKDELKRGYGLKGTSGFNKMGCYQCNGYNVNCPSYIIFTNGDEEWKK